MNVIPVCVHNRPLDSKAQSDGEISEVPVETVCKLSLLHLLYAESHD